MARKKFLKRLVRGDIMKKCVRKTELEKNTVPNLKRDNLISLRIFIEKFHEITKLSGT